MTSWRSNNFLTQGYCCCCTATAAFLLLLLFFERALLLLMLMLPLLMLNANAAATVDTQSIFPLLREFMKY